MLKIELIWRTLKVMSGRDITQYHFLLERSQHAQHNYLQTSRPSKWMKLLSVSEFSKGGRVMVWMEGKGSIISVCLWGPFSSCTSFQKVISLMAFVGRHFYKILTWTHLIFTFFGESYLIWGMFTSVEMLLLKAACRSFESPHAWISIFKFSWQLLHSPEHAGSKFLLKHVITSNDLAPAMWCQVMASGGNVNKRKLASWR